MNWKIIVTGIISVIVFVVGFNFLLSSLSKEQGKIKEEIGKKVIVGRDTMQIVDYSTIMEQYTLSNGQKVSIEFGKNNAFK